MAGSMVTAQQLVDERFEANKGFIQQTIDPKRYTTRPCPLQHPTAVYKKVDVSCNYTTTDQTLTQMWLANHERVPNSTGLIQWFPKDGTDSIYHCGIIPQGAQSYTWENLLSSPPVMRTIKVGSLTANTGTNPTTAVSGVNRFIYSRALAVPRFGDEAAINVAPDIGKQFSASRVYGGLLEAFSTTIASGATALNGVISTAVVSDTRDVAQSEDGTDCFSVVDLAQSCRTVKEIVKEVSISTGVINVVGSDIDAEYRPPDAYAVDRLYGGWSSNVLSGSGPILVNTTADALVGVTHMLGAWLSPWGVQCEEGCYGNVQNGTFTYQAGNYPAMPVEIPSLSETGCVDVKIDCMADTNNVASAGYDASGSVSFDVMVEHWFAGIGDNAAGTLEYKVLRSFKRTVVPIANNINSYPTPSGNFGGLANNYGQEIGGTFSVRDQWIAEGGYAKMGKFIGCKIMINANRDVGTTALGGSWQIRLYSLGNGTVQNNTGSTQIMPYLNFPSVSLRASDIFVPGKCGPCHLIRYDQMGIGQNLRITGCINTESVAKGNIAPYVQDSVMYSARTSDTNVYPLVYELYNGISPFKCSWSRPEWLSFVDAYIINFTPEKLDEIAQGDKRIKTAVQAAGIFSTLGSGLGGLMGNVLGNRHLGSAIGGIAGNVLDSAVGARGQFGVDSAGAFAPQFGAAGQFGAVNNSVTNAAGQFGGIRGRNYTN